MLKTETVNFERRSMNGELRRRGGRRFFSSAVLSSWFVVFTFRPLWAMRIVSLLPSNTEILDALDVGEQIVGITRFDRPSAGREMVGDFFQPSLEKIVALHPDYLVVGQSASSRVTRRLQELGFPTVEVPNPRSLEELFDSFRLLARTVHREARAEEIIEDMRSRFQKITERSARIPKRLRTYIEIDTPFWTIGGHDFLSEAIGTTGAKNIFSDLERPSAQVSPEVIVERDPELIISFDLKAAQLARRAGWKNVSAIRKNFVIDDQDRDRLSRPSPRLIDGIEDLQAKIESLMIKNAPRL